MSRSSLILTPTNNNIAPSLELASLTHRSSVCSKQTSFHKSSIDKLIASTIRTSPQGLTPPAIPIGSLLVCTSAEAAVQCRARHPRDRDDLHFRHQRFEGRCLTLALWSLYFNLRHIAIEATLQRPYWIATNQEVSHIIYSLGTSKLRFLWHI